MCIWLILHIIAFDLDTIKMIMNIFDTDRSGTIGFNEFAGLYKVSTCSFGILRTQDSQYIEDWQG